MGILAEGIQQTHSLNFSKMEDFEMEVKKTKKNKEDFGEQMREEWKEFTKDSEKAMKEIKDTLADVGKDNRDNMVGWTVGGVIFVLLLVLLWPWFSWDMVFPRLSTDMKTKQDYLV